MDAPLLLVVCSGPDSGSVTALHRGSYEVGRRSRSGTGTAVNTAPRIAIADPALSRKHALLVVGTDSVEVRDQGSANGTWVDGRPVNAAVVDTGSTLRFGYSSCRLAVPSAAPDPESARTDPFEPQTVHLSEQGQKGGLLLVGALLPLILGVVLALATGMWMFLAFSGLSAVTALLGAAGARRRRREQTRAIDEAAGEDARGRRLAAPDPGTTALAAVLGTVEGSFGRPSAPVTSAAPPGLALHQADDAGPCYPVRIGTAPQPANLVPVPPSSRFVAPVLPDAPVILRLGRDRDICLRGPDAGALCRTILLQAASAEASGSTLHIVCAGSSADWEPAARFLPGVTFAALPEASAARAASAGARIAALHKDAGFGAGTVLALCLTGGWSQHAGDLLAALPDTLREHTSVVRLGGGPAAVTVSMSSLRGIYADGTNTLEFIPDLIRPETFERLSRALAASRAAGCGAGPAPSAAVARVPELAAFGMHHPSEPDDILRSWKLGTAGSAAVVGMAADGPVTLDLQKDGPHFLVGGTTGSGKSEFLRSFIAALAAGHPPDAVTFLLIDFKGGSGLEPLGGLPHTVGLLTDLSAGDVARALMSLRAEVRRREALFAEAGADSMAAYNLRPGAAGPLPRLLVVVDEFRMLADEVPAALPELMRIAAIGRSLGLHLLLATQRPQGALTSDIRANIATTIALRVSSAAESRDILGSDCAAAIPAALPGRAFVAKGG
ncbi:FHA domain-containing protein [Arthrobacter sp. zg-Y40]|uniref:FtsK/SpoIIIE domain-containing protein n=1 Tax=Arthrobacter sp. zg-Y40 TaxID=2886939 RepID=UPI001D138E33|nr:FtsK/SpoIIIE domain-containing protein [Arthrobacter sp. zg-Y40]MCC3277726.1 FHA domain-containing protein [Arthrobacter sp. zg-Y40]